MAGDGLLCQPLLQAVEEALEEYGKSLVRQAGASSYKSHLRVWKDSRDKEV